MYRNYILTLLFVLAAGASAQAAAQPVMLFPQPKDAKLLPQAPVALDPVLPP